MCFKDEAAKANKKATQIQQQFRSRALGLADRQFELEKPLTEQAVSRGEFGQSFYPTLQNYLNSPIENEYFQRTANKGLDTLRNKFSLYGNPSSGPSQVAGGEYLANLTGQALENRNRNLINVAGFQGQPVPTQVPAFLGLAGNATDNLSSLALNRGSQGNPFAQLLGTVGGATLGSFLGPAGMAIGGRL